MGRSGSYAALAILFKISPLIILSIFLFSPAGYAQPADSPWPMFRHDAKHTGRSIYAGPRVGFFAWSYIAGEFISSSPAIGPDGQVYVGSYDNKIYALNAAGTLSWSYSTGVSVWSSPARGYGGKIYIGAWFNRISALNSTGSLSWTYLTGGWVYSPPTIDSGESIYVGSYEDNKLYALNSTGSLLWTYVTGGGVVSSPAIGTGGKIYIGSRDNRIYALNSTGSLSWSHLTGGWVDSSPAIGTGDQVYIGSWDSRIYAINSIGSLAWSYDTGGYVESSAAIGSNGRVYIGSNDTMLYALNSTGSLSWTYETGGNVESSAAIGSNRRVYVGSGDNRVYAINPIGSLAWSYVTGAFVDSSPAIGDNGRLYFGSRDNRLYCLSERDKLAIMKKEGVNDTNLYYYNSLLEGDWTYWDAIARNPSALSRDLWVIPIGNDAVGMAAIPGESPDRLFVLKMEAASDVNLYLYNGLAAGDWSYWDCIARNPSAMARDLWVMPVGNDAIGMAAVDDMNSDGYDDLSILKKEGANDLNIYYYNALLPGDWNYWDAISRNPSPLARDLWVIPVGNDAVGMTSIDLDGGQRELAIIRQEGANDLNLYCYNNLDAGDWTYWDAIARNPSPLARDLWVVPVGNDAIGMAAIDATGDAQDELAILKKEGAGDVNIYYYNAPVPGDWTYWDCLARNPSAMARDLWAIPVGNDAVGMTAVRTE